MPANDVVICSDALPGVTIGGRESRLLDMAPLATATGATFRLVTLRRDRAPLAVGGGAIQLCPVARAPRVDQQRKRSCLNGLVLVISTAWWLLWNKADLVEFDQIPHAAVPLGLLVCRLTRKPTIVHWFEAWALSDWMRYLGPLAGVLAFAGERISLRIAPAMAISQFTSGRIKAIHHAPGKHIAVVPPGFARRGLRTKADRGYHLGFVGRLLPHKRVDVFLRLVADVRPFIPDLRAIVVGEGEQMDAARHMAQQLGVDSSVEFTGKVERHEDVLRIVGDMELLVVCSEREGFGLVILEANERGVPVLVRQSAANGAMALVQHGVNGFACRDQAEMAKAAVNYLTDAAGRERMRLAALEAMTRYSADAIIDSLLNAYAAARTGQLSFSGRES